MTVAPLDEVAQGNRNPMSERETREQIEALRNEITRLGEDIASVGQAKIENYKAAIENLTQNAVTASVDAFKTARNQASQIEHKFEDQVRAYPMRALFIAGSVGLLAGMLVRRK